MRPALAGSTPFPRGPHSVGVSPGWASSSALEEEEEDLFKADAVNEEDSERDRATQV